MFNSVQYSSNTAPQLSNTASIVIQHCHNISSGKERKRKNREREREKSRCAVMSPKMSVEAVLKECWGGFGGVLGQCWISDEAMLKECWGIVGGVLGQCWKVVGQCWRSIGRCWKCFGAVFAGCRSWRERPTTQAYKKWSTVCKNASILTGIILKNS